MKPCATHTKSALAGWRPSAESVHGFGCRSGAEYVVALRDRGQERTVIRFVRTSAGAPGAVAHRAWYKRAPSHGEWVADA